MREILKQLAQHAASYLHTPSLNIRLLFSNPPCPICDFTKTTYRTQNSRFKIYQCVSCSHTFVGNPWSHGQLARLYQGKCYWEQDRHHQGIYDIRKKEEWKVFVESRISALVSSGVDLNAMPAGTTCLEIGCSEGYLLAELKRRGLEVVGCEVNNTVCDMGRSELGLNIVNKPIENCDFRDESFDLILSFHAFEHLINPADVLMLCRRMLKTGGTILIEVPVGDEELNNTDHIHFFTKESGERLFNRVFGNVRITDHSYVTAQDVRIGSVYLSAIKQA